MSIATFWWLLAGVAVAAELTTGTFYLLMVALGLAAGAVGAHLGLAPAVQIVLAALVGGGATTLWHWQRAGQAPASPTAENRDINLDVGERINVASWSVDRTTRVPYRGSLWTARLAPGVPLAPGEHVIKAVEGNWLVLVPSP